jgi:hypothetical protein
VVDHIHQLILLQEDLEIRPADKLVGQTVAEAEAAAEQLLQIQMNGIQMDSHHSMPLQVVVAVAEVLQHLVVMVLQEIQEIQDQQEILVLQL